MKEGKVLPSDVYMDLLISIPLNKLHKTKRKIDVVIPLLGSHMRPDCFSEFPEGNFVDEFAGYTFYVYSDFPDYKGEKDNREDIEKYLEQYDWNIYEVDKKDTRGRKRGATKFKYYFRRHIEGDGDSKKN